jgi:hypothetical protein
MVETSHCAYMASGYTLIMRGCREFVGISRHFFFDAFVIGLTYAHFVHNVHQSLQLHETMADTNGGPDVLQFLLDGLGVKKMPVTEQVNGRKFIRGEPAEIETGLYAILTQEGDCLSLLKHFVGVDPLHLTVDDYRRVFAMYGKSTCGRMIKMCAEYSRRCFEEYGEYGHLDEEKWVRYAERTPRETIEGIECLDGRRYIVGEYVEIEEGLWAVLEDEGATHPNLNRELAKLAGADPLQLTSVEYRKIFATWRGRKVASVVNRCADYSDRRRREDKFLRKRALKIAVLGLWQNVLTRHR